MSHPQEVGGCGCGGLPSVYFLRPDGFASGYKMGTTCSGQTARMTTADGVTWTTVDPIQVVAIEGDPPRDVHATMTVSGLARGQVNVEFKFADGAEEMLSQYTITQFFQPHRALPTRLTNYNTAATNLGFVMYPCIEPYYAGVGDFCASPCPIPGVWSLWAVVQFPESVGCTCAGAVIVSNSCTGFSTGCEAGGVGPIGSWGVNPDLGTITVSITDDGTPSGVTTVWAATGVDVCALAENGIAAEVPHSSGPCTGSVIIQLFAMDESGNIIGGGERLTCPEDPPPCQGRSAWRLKRKPCFGFSPPKYMYYWEAEYEYCEGGYDCVGGYDCYPSPPFEISDSPLTDEEAEALGYIDLLDVYDDSGECGCSATPYTPPDCPAGCEDCGDVEDDKTFTIAGAGYPHDGTYTLVKGDCNFVVSGATPTACCWRGTNPDLMSFAELWWEGGSWFMQFDSGPFYSGAGDECDSTINLSLISGGGGIFPSTIEVT